jgi:hypothetical protein
MPAKLVAKMPVRRRRAGQPAENQVIMALSLERQWPACEAEVAGFVTQQPWLCNGGASYRPELCVTHDPEKWAPVFGKDHAQAKC